MSQDHSKTGNLYLELRDEIVRRRDGDRFWSIRELMKRHGVSQLVVDRTVSRLRHEGLLTAERGRGLFIRNTGIEAFAADGSARNIAVFLPRWLSPDIEELHQTAARLNTAKRQHAIVCENFDFIHAIPRDLEATTRNLAGLIIQPSSQEMEPEDIACLYTYLKNCPVVILGRHLDNIGIPCVGLDDRFCAQQAMHWLHSHGHRRIGLLLSEPHNRVIMARLQAALDYAKLHRLELEIFDCETKSGEVSETKAYHDFSRRIQAGLSVSALLGISGDSLAGAVNACHNHGLRIPADLSVVTIAGERKTATLFPPIDTIPANVGQQMENALQRITHTAGKEIPTTSNMSSVYLQTELLQRGSVIRRQEE